ncbi:MAG: hypothetical protein K940chlam2_00849 [Chlamydiae bacterium]|nr:hypothetical protein [Chlamydiota bacterium]
MFKAVLTAMLCLCATIFADQTITHDSSILSISDEQVQLNPERIFFRDGGIFLETDTYGVIQLNEVIFDGEDYYCGSRVIGGVYICTN